jgi:hypothetical protein
LTVLHVTGMLETAGLDDEPGPNALESMVIVPVPSAFKSIVIMMPASCFHVPTIGSVPDDVHPASVATSETMPKTITVFINDLRYTRTIFTHLSIAWIIAVWYRPVKDKTVLYIFILDSIQAVIHMLISFVA